MNYPFSAIVAQEQLKTALLICAVNPSIGGVVIRGDKGSAKSTAARGLAEILPPIERKIGCAFNCTLDQPLAECDSCTDDSQIETVKVPFVNLPIGATEDRLLGSLDFERALKEGRRAFQPGLLASAHRGILYIDEVNLLPDHLVDVILDVAAMGVNSVQREGLSISHPSRIALIGTMNLEEGDLRPQLLDRFAMLIEVKAPMDASTRVEVVRRRIEFESDQNAFVEKWQIDQEALRKNIVSAQNLLREVVLSDGLLHFISTLCCEFNVTSLRADIVMNKAARALAALDGRVEVQVSDVRRAAEIVLPHRMRKRPGDSSALDQQKLEELMAQAPKQTPPQSDRTKPEEDQFEPDSFGACSNAEQKMHDAQAESDLADKSKSLGEPAMAEQHFMPTALSAVARIAVAAPKEIKEFDSGKRTSAISFRNGPMIRALANSKPGGIAIDATIRHSVLRNGGELKVSKADLHEKIRASKRANLILFVVDASGSMAALKRMEAVKGSVISLLEDVYQKRDKVGVIAFRGESAELIVPATRSTKIAIDQMRELKTGGRTPLAHALDMAVQYLDQIGTAESESPLLVVLTDGKTNVAQSSENNPEAEALASAEAIANRNIPALVLDTEVGYIRFKKAKHLAEAMAATYMPLENLSAEGLTVTIHSFLRKLVRQ